MYWTLSQNTNSLHKVIKCDEPFRIYVYGIEQVVGVELSAPFRIHTRQNFLNFLQTNNIPSESWERNYLSINHYF